MPMIHPDDMPPGMHALYRALMARVAEPSVDAILKILTVLDPLYGLPDVILEVVAEQLAKEQAALFQKLLFAPLPHPDTVDAQLDLMFEMLPPPDADALYDRVAAATVTHCEMQAMLGKRATAAG
jgi:hypothetical protein